LREPLAPALSFRPEAAKRPALLACGVLSGISATLWRLDY